MQFFVSWQLPSRRVHGLSETRLCRGIVVVMDVLTSVLMRFPGRIRSTGALSASRLPPSSRRCHSACSGAYALNITPKLAGQVRPAGGPSVSKSLKANPDFALNYISSKRLGRCLRGPSPTIIPACTSNFIQSGGPAPGVVLARAPFDASDAPKLALADAAEGLRLSQLWLRHPPGVRPDRPR